MSIYIYDAFFSLSLPLSCLQIQQLRNEKLMYMKEFPERVQLLRNLGFEWDEAALPDEWERIRCGEGTPTRTVDPIRSVEAA